MLSKLLGYLIILGSAIVKVPQITKILRENSVEGLSLEMFVLEIIGYCDVELLLRSFSLVDILSAQLMDIFDNFRLVPTAKLY